MLDLKRLSHNTWISLGEAQSKCEHLADSALAPEQAKKLHQIYLAKGVFATTAIEGNTLSENQVLARLEGKLKLPPSKEYLGKEIDNIIKEANIIISPNGAYNDNKISLDQINSFNKGVLNGLSLDDDVVPGEFRKHSVVVGRYRGAPASDLDYLMSKFVDCLNEFPSIKGQEIVYGLLKAIFAHIYLAWIHPYGDGNGRTARLIEVNTLFQAGVPSSAAHLLSNHYNETRSEYYRQLDMASKSGGDIIPFINYAVQGFVDQIREQINFVKDKQLETAWVNYIYKEFNSSSSAKDIRQRDLLLLMSSMNEPLNYINAPWGLLYRDKSPKTFKRDLNFLLNKNLIYNAEGGYRPNTTILRAFLPARKNL